jgi:hypothetical protein
MTRSIVSSLLLALLCVSGAAHAGTVYVPLAGQTTVGPASYEVQVSIVNTAAASANVDQVLLGTDTDGTQRTGVTPSTLSVAGARTSVVKPGAAFRGLLEISGAADFRYSARLVSLSGGRSVDLPVIASGDVIKANGKLSLQGLVSTSTVTTDLALVNLGKAAAQCTVSLVRADGISLGASATLSLKSLSHRYFGNVFAGLVDGNGISDARAQVSCTQDFYAYALLADGATGNVAVTRPAASGESTLSLPGAPGGGTSCGSTGVACFDASGVVHQPTPANPVGRVTFTIPAATYKRFKMSLDITVGPWYSRDPSAKHLIYWFVIDKNFDMPGMLFFRGPSSYTALVRHGIGLTHPQKGKIEKSFQATPGRTYHVENDYDMGNRIYKVTITDKATGEVKVILPDVPNVPQFTTKAGQRFLIDMGFKENAVPDEVPSYNWVYQNIHIEAFQ